MVTDAFGVSKAARHRLRRIVNETVGQSVSADYEKRKRSKVAKYIVKEGDGYVVMSEKGKRLSKPASKAQAAKRLRQIEYFKHQGA